jgi:serine protease Do
MVHRCRRFAVIAATGAAAAAVVLTSAGIPALGLRDNTARAIDLFGKDEPKSDVGAGPDGRFWEEEKEDAPAVVPEGVPASFADLAERVSPAVVNVQTSRTVTSGPAHLPRQFEEFFGPFGGSGEPHQFQVPSLGSGFVISPDGYIVTNDHVIEGVDKITVSFRDSRELPAEVVGRDPKTDIALIRVKSDKPLVAVPLGDSDRVRPGEWVVAIGNPFGFEHTVTAGIVSAKHRVIGQGSYDDFIQTDAAINPGNSGGPLINLRGEVIGINTAINPRANTIGFAVPINMAKAILPQLRADGKVTRGWLGVVIQDVTPELAEEFKLQENKGALVSKVVPDGPAAEAGLERGDVIVEFDGKPIDEMKELPRVVAATPVEKKVGLVVVREGKRKALSVRIGRLEEPEVELASAPGSHAGTLGLRVQDLTPELAEQFGVEGDGGVLVTDIEPGSPADQAELKRGDVIIEIDRKEVASVKDLRERLAKADDKVLMLIRRGDATLYVPVKRGKS